MLDDFQVLDKQPNAQVPKSPLLLASVQVISEVKPIPGYDKIQLVKVKGYSCIDGIGRKVGDKIIFFAPEAVIPENAVFDALPGLRKHCYREAYKGYVVTTMKMAGQVSQGLVLDIDTVLSAFPALIKDNCTVGKNITDILGVTKYGPIPKYDKDGNLIIQPPNPGIVGSLPPFIRVTDEANIQDYPEVFTATGAPTSWDITLKLDGSSITVFAVYEREPNDGELKIRTGVCSRKMEIQPVGAFEDIQMYFEQIEHYHLIEVVKSVLSNKEPVEGEGVYIQAELVGDKMNENRMGFPEGVRDLFAFNFKSFNFGESKHENNWLANLWLMSLVPDPDGEYVKDVLPIRQDVVLTCIQDIEDILKSYPDGVELEGYGKINPIEGFVIRPHGDKNLTYTPPPVGDEQPSAIPMSFKWLNPEYELAKKEAKRDKKK